MVDDHGWEVLKKAAKEVTPGNKADYYLVFKSLSTFFLDVSLGIIPGFSITSLSGRNPEIDSANAEDICDQGGTYAFPTSAGTLSVVSTNANDTSAGTGARTVKVTGLDSSYAPLEETVSMNGTTPVVTAGSFIRVLSARVMTAGNSATNEGDISVTKSGDTLAKIESECGRSLMAIYTVPTGKTGYITRMFGNIIPSPGATGTKDGEIQFWVRQFGEIFRRERVLGLVTLGNTFPNVDIQTFVPLVEKSDVKFRYRGNQNNTQIITGFDILLKDNS